MIMSTQISAARAMLRWTQADLSVASGISEISVKNIESGSTDPRTSTLGAIVRALESAGIEFTNGGQPGVRLQPMRIGDRVRLVKGTMTWGGFGEMRDQIARVEAFFDDGTSLKRIIVRFPNGQVTAAMDPGMFQRAPAERRSGVQRGDIFRFPHPRTGRDDDFEAINVLGAHVELKALGADYPSDLDRVVTALCVDVERYRQPEPGS